MVEITDINHVSLVIKDVAASRKFYCDILGMVEVPRPATFKFGGAWFRKGSAEIHLIQEDDAVQTPGDAAPKVNEHQDISLARHIGFAITDMDEVVNVLNRHGIPIVTGPRPRGDGVLQLYCHDPDGHLVELHTLI